MRVDLLHKPVPSLPLKVGVLPLKLGVLLACAVAGFSAAPLAAQTLARPGWVGSGLGSEQWWRNAIFYRVDVARFQDSDGDGTGDLPGLVQRLDYLKSVGVDAIVIAPPTDENAFGDLVRETNARHIRIVVAFDSGADILGKARLWLTRGAAGISIEPALLIPDPNTHAAAPSVRDLRTLADSFPGGRVLLAPGGNAAQTGAAELIAFPLLASPGDFGAASFRRTLMALQNPPAGVPLIESNGATRTQYGDDPIRSAGLQAIVAAQLLTSHGAVSLLYGQELGTFPQAFTMQWTPTNVTPPKVEAAAEEVEAKPAAAPPVDPNVYTAFKPYVPPKPAPKPKPVDAPVDPNTLPGFTSGKLAEGEGHSAANVAVKDADPKSLLNFYRRLSQLHHDNASLRSGATTILDHDADNALVWVRHAPNGSRTAGNVIVACNLGDKLLTLSVDTDLTKLHIRPGTLRPLLASWTAVPIAQYSNHIVVPPYSVYIGELYH